MLQLNKFQNSGWEFIRQCWLIIQLKKHFNWIITKHPKFKYYISTGKLYIDSRHKLAAISTYRHHREVIALESLEEVCYSALQTATNEDTISDVIEKDGSESIYVTWNKLKTANLYYEFILMGITSHSNPPNTLGPKIKGVWETYSSASPNPSHSDHWKPCRSGQTDWSLPPVSADQSSQQSPSETKRSCSTEKKTVTVSCYRNHCGLTYCSSSTFP